jgi:hypothetical protein
MLAQMVNTTTNATTTTVEEMGAADAARRVFDALTVDLENMANVNGLSVVCTQDSKHNTCLAFLTEGRGPSGATNGRFMAIAYQLNGNNLTRSVDPVTWDNLQVGQAAVTAASSSTASTSVLASSALRFQTVVLLDNGTTVPLPDSSSSSSTANVSWESTTVNNSPLPAGYYSLIRSIAPVDPLNPRVKGLMVGLATLDGESINLPNAGQMATALLSPVGSQTPIDAWEADRGASTFLHAYPKPAVTALNLGQQIYILQ